MKKTILIALMAIVATGAVIAQDTNEKKERRGRDGDAEASQDRLGDPVIHSRALTGDKLPCFGHFADFVR